MAYEVYVRLMFNAPCLGNERHPDPEPNKMLRNSDGAVIFHHSWWRSVVGQAASAYNKHQKVVSKIRFNPEIDGTVKLYKRYYYTDDGRGTKVKRYKLHESFFCGDVIGVKALIPDAIPLDDFKELMDVVGAYYGISPFGWDRGFGRFKVVECGRVYGKRNGGDSDQRQLDVDSSNQSEVTETN